MKTLDLEFNCQALHTYPRGFNGERFLEVKAIDVNGIDLDTKEIANEISIRTMIEAHGLTNVLDYLIDEHKTELLDAIKELQP